MAKFSIADFKKGNFLISIIIVSVLILVIFSAEWFSFTPKTAEFGFPKFYGKDKEKSERIDKNIVDTELQNKLKKLNSVEQVKLLMTPGAVTHQADLGEGGQIRTTLTQSDLTWADLRSTQSRRYLKEVSVRAKNLADTIEIKYLKSRDALYNYSANIDAVIAGEDRSRTAKQVLSYLERLDVIVTNAMVAEKTPRWALIEWSKISLAPITGNRSAVKSELVPKFNPQLLMNSVMIYKTGSDTGKFNPRAEPKLAFNASMKGSEIRKVTLYSDRVYIDSVYKYADRRNPEIIHLQAKDINADGVFTFEVYDKYENVFYKRYLWKYINQAGCWRKSLRDNSYYLAIPVTNNPVVLDAMFTYSARRDFGVGNLFKPRSPILLVKF